jgi:hypothetical protein
MTAERPKGAQTEMTAGRRRFLRGLIGLAGLLKLNLAVSARAQAGMGDLAEVPRTVPATCRCREAARRRQAEAIEAGILLCVGGPPYCSYGKPLPECEGWDVSQP